MKKIKKYTNSLIKTNKLILLLKKGGIKRTSKQAIYEIKDHINSYINNAINLLKWEMETHGRKTLTKKDVEEAFGNMKKEEKGWEI